MEGDGKMNLKKTIVCVVSAATLLSAVSPTTSFAKSNKPSIKTTEEQAAEVQSLFDLIEEINKSGLDMENLSVNEKHEIDKLSNEAQELYYIYEQTINEQGTDLDKAIATLATYYQKNVEDSTNTYRQLSTSTIGNYKEYYLTHQQVVDITKAAGLHSGGWTFISAIAKIFGKNPTALTAMIIAIPTLGAATLNACNRYDKGVIIRDFRVGATHNFSCFPRK